VKSGRYQDDLIFDVVQSITEHGIAVFGHSDLVHRAHTGRRSVPY